MVLIEYSMVSFQQYLQWESTFSTAKPQASGLNVGLVV